MDVCFHAALICNNYSTFLLMCSGNLKRRGVTNHRYAARMHLLLRTQRYFCCCFILFHIMTKIICKIFIVF